VVLITWILRCAWSIAWLQNTQICRRSSSMSFCKGFSWVGHVMMKTVRICEMLSISDIHQTMAMSNNIHIMNQLSLGIFRRLFGHYVYSVTQRSFTDCCVIVSVRRYSGEEYWKNVEAGVTFDIPPSVEWRCHRCLNTFDQLRKPTQILENQCPVKMGLSF
jgi:hypothetical protein